VYKLYRCQRFTTSQLKRPILDSTKEQRDNRRHLWSGGTGLSGAPPDSVRCTRGLQLKLATFGKFQRRLHYNSPDCPVHTGHVRCSKEGWPQELASLGNSLELLRYNSPDCPVYTGLSGVTAEQRLFRRQRLPATP
jgi:hypothetical protein